MSDLEFDYVIVGAGAAGCTLANQLSAQLDVTVCLLEAGPMDKHPTVRVPAGFTRVIGNASRTWSFETEPTVQTANRSIPLIQGKMLGGSTSLNGMVYVRGQRADFDAWAALGNPGWSYKEVLPFFRALESRTFGEPEYSGRSGPVNVTRVRWRDPACSAFMEAAVENGLPINPDYNGREQKGVDFTQATIHRRRRVSASTAFLQTATRRRNLHVVTHAVAERILFSTNRAVGVRYVRDGQPMSVKARREVIVSAGTINTARLLQISGVGDPDWLVQLGVPLVNALPGVGRNLRDHYLCTLVAGGQRFRSINQLAAWPRLGLQLARYVLGAVSILELPPPVMHCFMKSADDGRDADIQGVFTPASNHRVHSAKLDSAAGMTFGFWQHRPMSSGYVRAVSTSLCEQPLIQPNYLADERDRAVVVAGFRLMRNLLRSQSLKPYIREETLPGEHVETDEALLQFAQQTGRTAYHFVGTASMGPASNRLSVVGADLRVHRMESLRVVDASIMPQMISGNTQATTMMLALKAADIIRRQSR
ncbi:GMC family oxidoreductase N-terminal domain-containing protein [Paraburkholderia sp. A3BS-1L]|uniref:GMC family oxidoreductase n=1 Tax=Paraburkholderia sp. A3BS-1L TaxID=3028375 RepID=UPI003DA93118